jgi:hypothetical protein
MGEGDGLKAPGQQIPAGIIVREIDAIEEMAAIARVRAHGIWPPLRAQPIPRLVGPFQGQLVLLLRGGDPGGADRIEIEEKPQAPDDVGVGCRRLHILQHPVCRPGQEGRDHRVQGDVDGRGLAVPGDGSLSQLVEVIEVTRYGGTPCVQDA